MNNLPAQLKQAYLRQRQYYERIRNLVREQMGVMESAPDPGVVLDLCRRIEELMADIESIERAIEPAKRCWQKSGPRRDEELDAVLAGIEEAISEIAENQQAVQQRLLDYVQSQRQKADGARESIRSSRARSLYKAG